MKYVAGFVVLCTALAGCSVPRSRAEGGQFPVIKSIQPQRF